MKKFTKVFVFIALSLFLTGCEHTYNVNITEDLKVEESIRINQQVNIYAEDDPADACVVFNEVKPELKERFTNANYTIVDNSTYDRIKIDVTRKSSFEAFNSLILDELYDKVDAYCTSDKCILNASVSQSRQEDDTEGDGTYTDFKINITVPYKVISNNADEVDLQRNTFIWYYINAEKKSDINLIFEKSGQNIIIANRNTKIFWTSVWTVLGVIAMIFIMRILYKIRKNSRPNF